MEYELGQIIEFTDVYPDGLYDFVVTNGYTLKEIEPTEETRRVQIVEKHQPTPEEEQQRVAMLHMTPLDFLKAIIKMGISYDTIKGIMEANPEVDMEMKYCQNVYRGHPMVNQFAAQFGVSQEQLDYIFKKANGEVD